MLLISSFFQHRWNATKGRTRNDHAHGIQTSVKDVYLGRVFHGQGPRLW